ncbi:MAG: hypothetical protein IKE28_04020 [Solobacterium sp.]|nr:hypothetical protein [Solobacterium sp.]
MKKLMTIAAVCLLALSACAKKPEETAEPQTTDAEPTVETETAKYPPVTTLDDEGVKTLLKVYASVMDETFGAECDWNTPYKEDDVARYYEVKNFADADELKEYLAVYVDEKLLEESSLLNDFQMVDDKFCAIRGGKGYGYYGIDPDSYEMTGDDQAKVQFTLMQEPQEGSFAMIGFKEADGTWKVASVELPEGFN